MGLYFVACKSSSFNLEPAATVTLQGSSTVAAGSGLNEWVANDVNLHSAFFGQYLKIPISPGENAPEEFRLATFVPDFYTIPSLALRALLA